MFMDMVMKMIKLKSAGLGWFLFPVLLFLVGCVHQPGQKQAQTAGRGAVSAVEPNNVIPDYAARSLDAAGGLTAWRKAAIISADCVVSFYRPDGSFYLTTQRHRINPWDGSIQVSGSESEGDFSWQYAGGKTSVSKGTGQAAAMPADISQRHFAAAVLDIMTAPVRFLDSSAIFTVRSEPVRLEGLWYYALDRTDSNTVGVEKQSASRTVFYQSRENSMVDIIWFADAGQDLYLAVRGAEYSKIGDSGIVIPRRVEIFKTGADGVFQQHVVKIDYYSPVSADR